MKPKLVKLVPEYSAVKPPDTPELILIKMDFPLGIMIVIIGAELCTNIVLPALAGLGSSFQSTRVISSPALLTISLT